MAAGGMGVIFSQAVSKSTNMVQADFPNMIFSFGVLSSIEKSAHKNTLLQGGCGWGLGGVQSERMRPSSIRNVSLYEPITAREREILALIGEHRTNKEIAESLHLALSTVKWYTKQIYGKLAVENRRAAVERATALGILGSNQTKPYPHNLPTPGTPFVGREEEVEKIISLLRRDEFRMITLQGLGGSGKTRLALEVALTLVKSGANPFPDGIWFVFLTPIQNYDPIIQAIGNAIGYNFFDKDRDYLQQLTDYLRPKDLLLILDNFEHLISNESMRLLAEIIARAPGIKILITSRIRLNIRGEQLFLVAGMKIPGVKALQSSGWESFSAIKFFRLCARRVQPTFEIDEGNSASVVRICQLVEGMPLGIELAAPWMELLTPQEIATEIAQSLDFLALDQADVPDRQRSVRAVFESSWKFLSEDEQKAFLRLCAFVGSFSREAAQQVSGASLQTLLKLANKSWLERTDGGRFQLHELMRQYGEEKLKADAGEWHRAKDSHAAYYADFVAEQSLRMRSSEQLAGLIAIHEEFNFNIKISWDWLVGEQRWEDVIKKMALGLYHYALIYMRIANLTPWIKSAMRRLASETRSRERLSYTILGTLEVFCEENSEAKSFNWTERLTALWPLVIDYNLAEKMGFWYALLAGMIYSNNLVPDAKVQLEEAVAYARKKGDPWVLGMSLLIKSNWLQGFAPNKGPLLEASRVFKNLGVPYEQGLVAAMLEGLAIQKKSSPSEIRHYFEIKNEFFKKLGDLYPFLIGFFSSASDYFQIGEIDYAFSYFHEQQSFFEKVDDMQRVADSLHWESLFAVRYSTFEHAVRTRQRSMEIMRNLDQPSHFSWGLFEFGEMYRVFGEQEKALDLYEQAHEGFERMNIILGLGYYQRAYGDLALEDARYADALKYFQEYVKYARQDNHLWSMAQAQAKLALAHAYLGELEQSRQELQTALTEMRDWGKDDLILQILLAEPVCLLQERRSEEAIELSAFILTHPVSWNETKQQAKRTLEAASRDLPQEVVESAKERGKKLSLKTVLNRYLSSLQGD
jgi:predicted ATPase/DNA-binding CsgD family transcriptional regulator